MSSADSASVDKRFLSNAMASFLQIGAVLLLLSWCFSIISPFITIIAWGLIIAISLYPFHRKLTGTFGGREKLSSMFLVLAGLAILLIPTWVLTESSVTALRSVAENVQDGAIIVAPPDPGVAEWPIVGESIYSVWSSAVSNLEDTLNQFKPQLLSFGQWALGFAGSTAIGILQFVLSIIIAGVFLMMAESGYKVALAIGSSLADARGKALLDISIQTIRSVTKGVLGVAIIQMILAAIGFVAMGVPAAGIWAGAVLMLAIMQLPAILILAPIVIWVFSVADPVPATIFAVYSFVVSICDSFLKPMFLGRGIDVPMLVILIGSIGGAVSSGIVGLFIGAVVLSVSYQLLVAWMGPDAEPDAASEETVST